MVSHVFYAATGFQEVNSNRVAKGVNRAAGNPCLLGLEVLKRCCTIRFFRGPSRPSEEVRAHISTDPESTLAGVWPCGARGALSPTPFLRRRIRMRCF